MNPTTAGAVAAVAVPVAVADAAVKSAGYAGSGPRSGSLINHGGRLGRAAVTLGVMARFDRITSNPLRMNGQPCIRDLRITVKRVVEALALYPEREALRAEYPEIDDEDIRQALGYAAAALEDEMLELPKTA